MGNITNPSINRWGKNQYWFRLWYTDKNYFLNLQSDTIINNIILVYLYYGMSFKVHPYINQYFFKNKYFTTYKRYLNYDLKYFRQDHYSNPISGVEEVYPIRKEQEDIYNTQIGIFRYQKWLVVNFYSFKIVKSSKKKIRKNKYKYNMFVVTGYSSVTKKTINSVKRLRFLIFNFLLKKLNLVQNKTTYLF